MQATCWSLSLLHLAPKPGNSLPRSVAVSSSPSSSCLYFPNCCSRESALVDAEYLRCHFSIFLSKALHSRGKDYLSKLQWVMCPEEFRFCFCSPFFFIEFLAPATNLIWSTATGQDKIAYFMLKHLPRFGMDFLPYIPFLTSGRGLMLFHTIIWKSFSTLLLPSGLFLSPHASQIFLNASFYFVYSCFWILTSFSITTR